MLDIFLVVAGVGLIILSYIVSDKMDAKNEKKEPETAKGDIWTPKDEKRIRDRIEDIVADRTEEAMIRTDDQLSQISNEKIMAVSEFSDQILEKIKQNHTEVVFLYDMLNEKDSEVKKLLQEINTTKIKAEAVIRNTSAEAQNTKIEEKIVIEKPKTAMDILEQSAKEKKSITSKKSKEETVTKTGQADKIVKVIEDVAMVNRNMEAQDNKNAQILRLYEEGNSIIEIAKNLGLGQGEVKLVIDLFLGVKK